MAQSRTLLSIKNSVVALGFYLVNLMLQFYSRQVFFVELGTEVLGLNTTATSLLQFLNLAELGVGSAIGVTLYKPLLEKNYTAINEIVSLQGWLYKRIAYFIIIGSAVRGFSIRVNFPCGMLILRIPYCYSVQYWVIS